MWMSNTAASPQLSYPGLAANDTQRFTQNQGEPKPALHSTHPCTCVPPSPRGVSVMTGVAGALDFDCVGLLCLNPPDCEASPHGGPPLSLDVVGTESAPVT